MSYANFSNPKGGYSNQGQNSSILPTPKEKISVPKYKKEGDFTDKTVYKDGVGDYHVNHFIGYFDYKNVIYPNPELLKKFNTNFFNNFCQIFSPNNAAIASLSKYSHKNKKTVKFQINGNSKPKSMMSSLVSPIEDIKYFSGLVHPDWVSFEMLEDEQSFLGSTLKRNWAEKSEIELFSNVTAYARKFNIVTEENAMKFLTNLVEVNQHHFLAGRRSWAVGYDESLNLFFVETMAFERSSQCEYNVVEKTGKLRETIIELWTTLIYNFFEKFPVRPKFIFDIPKNFNLLKTDNYDLMGNYVLYKVEEEIIATKLLEKPWVQKAIKRHPGLLKDL